jgi:archaellum biogenesis ATPase FlaH
MMSKSNESIKNIIKELDSLGITISREEIEERRDILKRKINLMKRFQNNDKEALKELVQMSLKENKVIFDRLAKL